MNTTRVCVYFRQCIISLKWDDLATTPTALSGRKENVMMSGGGKSGVKLCHIFGITLHANVKDLTHETTNIGKENTFQTIICFHLPAISTLCCHSNSESSIPLRMISHFHSPRKFICLS